MRVGVVDNIRPACVLGKEEQRMQEVGDKGNLSCFLLRWSGVGWPLLPPLPLGAKQANALLLNIYSQQTIEYGASIGASAWWSGVEGLPHLPLGPKQANNLLLILENGKETDFD